MEIQEIVQEQKVFFDSFATYSYQFRKTQLLKLKQSIVDNQQLLIDAFKADLNKCEFDVVSTELYLVNCEIKYMLKHLKRLMRPKRVHTSLINFPSHGEKLCEPLGQVLIMSPWNYPFQLAICPLIGAIVAGNTAVVKPSAYTPRVSEAIAQILSVFPENYISVVLGGREQNQTLLDQKFDFIFFTGSKAVGRVVEEKASKNLTPIILELGGKSPCIVSRSADPKISAKRIVWGKFLNAGQTCIAPDYIFVHRNVYDAFVKEAINYTKQFYYQYNNLTSNFTQIVNEKHIERLKTLIMPEKVVFGGNIKGKTIEPTIMTDVAFDDPVMQQEIFGPIMPIIPYDNIDEVIRYVNSNDKPLALYYFGKIEAEANLIFSLVSSGGACWNDVIMHFTERKLPFGGVGESGMGSYHGKKSFYAFSHEKSILVKSRNKEIPLRYPPYTDKKCKFAYKYMGYKPKVH